MAKPYRFTPARRAALKRAQLVSARKRTGKAKSTKGSTAKKKVSSYSRIKRRQKIVQGVVLGGLVAGAVAGTVYNTRQNLKIRRLNATIAHDRRQSAASLLSMESHMSKLEGEAIKMGKSIDNAIKRQKHYRRSGNARLN